MLFGLINGKSSIEISETRNNILLKEEKLLNKENLVMSDFLSKSKDDHASWSDDKKRQISKGDENGELPPTVDVTEMFQTEPLENESVTNYDIFDDLNNIYSGKVDISQYKIPQHSENIMPDSVSVINEGTSGMILKYRSQKDGRMYAIKKLKNTNEDGYLFNSINEYLIMRKLNNSNFTVRTFELFNDNGFISFTLDYFGNLDLLNMMTNLRKNNIQTSTLFKDMIFLQLVNGLKYIHNNSIIHKDIKPENILIDDNGVLKITDFGYAIDEERLEKYDNSFQNNAAFFQRGTPSFKAPELFVINPDILTINNKIDVWSLAILYFQISTLSKPWNVSKGTEDKNYKWYNQTYTVKRLNELKSGYQIKQLLKGYDNQFVTGLNRFNDNCVITIINMLNPDNARRWDIVQVFKSDWMINCRIEYGKNENNNEVMKILKVLKSCMKR